MNTNHQTTSFDESSADAIYSEAWRKTAGMKATFWKALVSIILVIAITSTLIPSLSGIVTGSPDNTSTLLAALIRIIVNVVLITPLFTGLLMICIKHCTDMPAPINTLFQYIPYWKRLWIFPIVMTLFGLLINVFNDVPMIQMTLVLIAFLWTVTYLYYIPLSVEKNYPTSAALEMSRRTILQNLPRVFGFLLIAIIILFVSTLTLGFAFIWTLPWLCNAIAIFYRELFGIQMSLV